MDDELVPYSQGHQLGEELKRMGHPHEFHSYKGLFHYFSTSADDEATQGTWQDSLGCSPRWLEGE